MSDNQSLFTEITPSEETNLSGGFNYTLPSGTNLTVENNGTKGTNNGNSVGGGNQNVNFNAINPVA